VTVVGSIVVESRRYSGWLDPRYPIGYWQAVLTVTGDATGGLIGVNLVFQEATTPRLNSQMYSVERLGITRAASTDHVFSVAATNMAGPANEGFIQQYIYRTLGRSGGGSSAIEASQLTNLPWFIGSQRAVGITASLALVGANSDLVDVTFEAEGYRWSPRSVLIDGGPQRPPTGLYRA